MKLRDWSLRRWALIVAAIILLPLIGMRLHLKWQVHRAVAELREAGHPTTYEDLHRRQGVIEGATNLVTALTNAVHRLPKLEGKTRDLLPMIGMAKTPPAGEPWPEDIAAATGKYLEANREVLQEIHAALVITNAWWWASYNPDKWDTKGLTSAKSAASHLSLEAAFLAQAGQHESALHAAGLIFVIAERMYGDPILITHLVRIAIQSIGLSQLEYVLNSGEPSAEAIQQMRAILRRQLSQISMSHVYEGEFVFFLEPYFHRSQRAYIGIDWLAPKADTLEDFKQRVLVLAYRLSGLADRDSLYAVQINVEIMAKAATVAGQVELAKGGSALLPSTRGFRFHYWSEQHIASLIGRGPTAGFTGSPLTRHLESYGKLSAADAALAVAQYRLQHDGKLPGSLGELVPEYLEAVPVEPQSAKPFELIVTTDGYGIGRGTPVFKVKLNRDR